MGVLFNKMLLWLFFFAPYILYSSSINFIDDPADRLLLCPPGSVAGGVFLPRFGLTCTNPNTGKSIHIYNLHCSPGGSSTTLGCPPYCINGLQTRRATKDDKLFSMRYFSRDNVYSYGESYGYLPEHTFEPVLRCPYKQFICGFRALLAKRAYNKLGCSSPIVHLGIVCCDLK